jgi:hypothetical protein
LGYAFETISDLQKQISTVLLGCEKREQEYQKNVLMNMEEQTVAAINREHEIKCMVDNDPRLIANDSDMVPVGSHLAPLSKVDALRKVHDRYPSSAAAVSSFDKVSVRPATLHKEIASRSALHEHRSVESVASAVAAMRASARSDISSLGALLARKDVHFSRIKEDLAVQLVEKRQREEG